MRTEDGGREAGEGRPGTEDGSNDSNVLYLDTLLPTPTSRPPSPVPGPPSPVLRLPSLTARTVLLAWAFVPIIFFAMFRDGQVDPDLWWHLKAGEWMIRHGRVPHEEFFSYTGAGHLWVAHEWLTEILFWLLYKIGGMWGLVALQGVMTAAILGLIYLVTHGICENPGAAAASTWLVGIACYPFLRVRPHLFTFFLLGLVFALAFFYAKGYRRVVWTFPALIVLWVNLHGGYVIGLALGLALIMYESARCLLRRDLPPADAWRRCRALWGAGFLGVLAVAFNPNGPRMWSYPFHYLGNSSYTRGILEWKAPDFASGEFGGFEILLLVGFLTLALSRRRPHVAALLACAALLHQSLVVLRYIPFFALCFGPVLGWHLAALPVPQRLRRWQAQCREGEKAARLEPAPQLARSLSSGGGERPSLNLTLLSLLPAFLSFVAWRGIAEPAITDRAYPRQALRQLDTLRVPGNLLNDYKWGGYLLFHAYPAHRVFVDGRADAYPAKVMEDYLQVSRLKPGWREILDHYQVQSVLWPAEHPLTEALKLDPNWELRYQDAVAVLFTRRAPARLTTRG